MGLIPLSGQPLFWLTLFVVGMGLALGSNVYYISPGDNKTCACCTTFSAYLDQSLTSSAESQSNSTLVFMQGTHMLHTSLSFDGLSNVTLRGKHDLTSRILVGYANVSFTNCEKIAVNNLVFESTETDYENMALVTFVDTGDVSISDVEFHGNDLVGRSAVESVGSDINFTRTMFEGFSSQDGGAIAAKDSILAFWENSSFLQNAASKNGGAMYLESCQVNFQGLVKFLRNRAQLNGGALMANDASNLTFQGNSFRIFAFNSITQNQFEFNGGGAIALVESSLLINGLIHIEHNTAPNGGGLLAQNSFILMRGGHVVLRHNTASTTENGVVQLISTDELNTTGLYEALGGSIFLDDSELNLLSAAFVNSTAKFGGGIYSVNSKLNLHGNILADSCSARCGGAFYLNDSSSLNSTGFLRINSSSAHLKGSAVYTHMARADIRSKTIVHHCFQAHVHDTDGMELEGTMYLSHSTINFSGVTNFSNNSALEGAGIYALETTIHMSNRTLFAGNQAELNGGALYLERSRISLKDEVTMRANEAEVQGGGVYGSLMSVMFLTGTALYEGNMAAEGGMFALENGATMIASSPLSITAINNVATHNGGVIFYTDIISTTDCASRTHATLRPPPVCFLEFNASLPFDPSNLDIHLNFTNNRAGSAGSVMFGGTLTSCRMLVSETLGLDFLDNKCQIIEEGHYEDSPFQIIMLVSDPLPDKFSIASVPLKICFCKDGKPACSSNETKSVRVCRGELFSLSAVAVGQVNGPAPSTIRTDIDSQVEIKSHQQAQKTDKTCTDLFYRLFTTLSSFTLVLYPDGPCRDTGIARKEVHVTLLPCPDGFNLSRDGTECVCEDTLLRLNATCHIDTGSIEISAGKWLMAIYDNGSYLGMATHPYCPFSYCIDTPVNVTLDNADVLCDYNRTGWLCGACRENFSLALGSQRCLHCSNTYLSLLIPFALAGVLLVVFLLVLDLTIAKGTINGLILYANIVQANKAVFLPKNERNILTVFIAWMNLDLGIESCFFDGLTAHTHTWLQYAFPLYVWFLIGLIALVSHKSRNVSKLLGTNPVAVLATLLLISYAKVLRTIISAFSRTLLETPTGTRTVWTYDGNVEYSVSLEHMALVAVALLALVILFLPFSFLLLFGWKLQNHSDLRALRWINKIKPFMDTVYGPYRTETIPRCWTGFLLFVRCGLFLTFTFNGLSPNAGGTSTSLLAVSAVFAGLSVLAWLNGRIYNALYADILEAVNMLNISIFAAATYHVKMVGGDQAALAYVSIFVAFALFLGVVTFHAYLKVKRRECWRRMKLEFLLKLWYHRLRRRIARKKRVTVRDSNQKKMTGASEEQPSISYVSLRELLLES